MHIAIPLENMQAVYGVQDIVRDLLAVSIG
jgi:hypothetical protein